MRYLEHSRYHASVSFQRCDYLLRFIDFPGLAPILEMHKTTPSLQRIQNPHRHSGQKGLVRQSPTEQLWRGPLLFPLLLFYYFLYAQSLGVLSLCYVYGFNCFILNIHISFPVLPLSWSSRKMNFFSIELHNVWSASALNAVACPFFISALVPDLHFRVLHWASPLFMVLSGLNFSPLCAYILGSQLCDAFCLTRAFRPSILQKSTKSGVPGQHIMKMLNKNPQTQRAYE